MKYIFTHAYFPFVWSPLAMAEWIEIDNKWKSDVIAVSPLAMAEWIEILNSIRTGFSSSVSASDGGVD